MFPSGLVSESNPRVFDRYPLDVCEGQVPLQRQLSRPEGDNSGSSKKDDVIPPRDTLRNSATFSATFGRRTRERKPTYVRDVELVTVCTIVEFLHEILPARRPCIIGNQHTVGWNVTRLPDAFTVDVTFRRPILLPSRVTFAAEGGNFAVRTARKGKTTIHLEGSVTAA